MEVFIVQATKEFEKVLRETANKINDEIVKSKTSLAAQAEVARWNAGRLAPQNPTMPAALVAPSPSIVAPASLSTPGVSARGAGRGGKKQRQLVVLEPDEDASDNEHTGNETESGENDSDWADEGAIALAP